MKTAAITVALLVGVFAAPHLGLAQSGCGPTESESTGDPGQASLGYFHDQLSPYGDWVAEPGYGEIWVPRVTVGWRPYTTGHWIYTDQGWAWVADESWGWAPFHYGRWFNASGRWGWVPGYTWAPAWVAWRNGGGYVGWAALPPAVGFRAGIGVVWGGVNVDVAIGPTAYSFVSERAILEPRLFSVIQPVGNNVAYVRNTTNITNITVVNNRVVNSGVSVQHIQQVTGRPVVVAAVSHQIGFSQPTVLARAARQTKTESFVNRPTPGTPVIAKAATHSVAPANTPQNFSSGQRVHKPAVTGTSAASGSTVVNPNHSSSPAGKRVVHTDSANKSTGSTGTTSSTGSTSNNHQTTGHTVHTTPSTAHEPPPGKPKPPPPHTANDKEHRPPR